jgi:hypothetical protein
MRKKIYTFSFYTLLLAVYGIFFSVESFYNFEGHSDAREIIHRAALVQSGSAANASLHCYPGPQKTRVRLNKRFHQEEFPPCTVYEVGAPVIYVTPRELGSLVVSPLPSVTVAHPQLRGPPCRA